MSVFVQRHADKVIGVLSGFDRLVLRGSLRRIAYATGLKAFLDRRNVLLKDFGQFAQETSKRVKEASLREANELDRPVVYLSSSRTRKDELARDLARAGGIEEGLVAILTCVEPCMTYEIFRNREEKRLVLQARLRKCLHHYRYAIDPVFGFTGTRIQTWFPFSVQITLNGREWLARELDREGVRYEREDNCFPWIEDVEKAQALMNRQLALGWAEELDRLAGLVNPVHDEVLEDRPPLQYYWSVHQSEWATDVMFETPAALAEIYRNLVSYAMTAFTSRDVMRFLGKKVSGRFAGEVVTDFKNRPEGIRVKHRVGRNSEKLYDKAGSILRVENTMNDPAPHLVYRPKEGEPDGDLEWRALRKGVADVHRRAMVSQAVNERYLDALSAADTSVRVGELLRDVSRRTRFKGRPVRALRPTDPLDIALLHVLALGQFAVDGLRNRDVQAVLFTTPTADPKERRRRSARATRLIRLLRAHRLIRKKPRTHRYAVTPRGHAVAAATLATQAASLEQLVNAA